MHVETFLHKLLGSTIHKSRIKSLSPVVNAIIRTKQLTLTQLGRGLETTGKERSGIRRVDRVLANTYYQEEAATLYACLARCVIGEKKHPIILVDWSSLPNSQRTTQTGEQCVLRASFAAEGRSITVYEAVYSKEAEGTKPAHNAFLKQLAKVLPAACCPIIVTDAGFKNPWFAAVQSFGWDYIGRLRGRVTYDDGSGFRPISALFPSARYAATCIGEVAIAATNPLKTTGYLYKHRLKGRKKYTKSGQVARDKDSKQYAKGYREPWVLVSSLTDSNDTGTAKKVVAIYKMRMTIEENFRDNKSTETGFRLNENRTIIAARYTVWLLLCALASLVAWIVGYTAEKQHLHYDFQANTYRHRRVLSFFYLGCQVIRKNIHLVIDWFEIKNIAWSQTI